MTAVGEWLKQIILLVILATLADLLLPTKAMQKYVRVVLGIAVIAAMLQPIVPLLRRDWADQVANAALQETTGTQPTIPQASVTSMQHVLTTEQQGAENRYADAAIQTDLQRACACQVQSIRIRGTGSPASPLGIDVRVRLVAQKRLQEIQTYMARTYNLPAAQVTVRGFGGGD